jgi:membrane protein implicated in regulation of membrane protease activity
MLTLYVICMVAGGGLVLLSAFGADGDVDGIDADGIDIDADAGLDFDADAGAEIGGGGGGGGAGEVAAGAMTVSNDANAIATTAGRDALWRTLFSFRFWTFASAFFGLTGVTLTFTTGLLSGMVAALAGATGAGIGLLADRTIRFMRRREVDSTIHMHDLVGREATVLLPVSKERPGKIRVQVGPREVEYLATTDEETPFARGDSAIVIDFSGDRARVVHPSTLLSRT